MFIHVDMDDLALSRFGGVMILIQRTHVPIILESPRLYASGQCRCWQKAARRPEATSVGASASFCGDEKSCQ
jgi:hypothetical protein